MKILINRVQQFNPFGQTLIFDDGTQEFDPDCTQTTPILTAQQYNGKAAKNEAEEWVPAPGSRDHQYETDMLGFKVGLTTIGIDGDGKAIYDYSVQTPTGVWFHGDGGDNTLHAPSSWQNERVAAEIIAWICVGEDAGTDFPSDTTAEQWEWIRSWERESASAQVDDWLEHRDRANRERTFNPERVVTNQPFPVVEPDAAATDGELGKRIAELSNRYLQHYVLQCQTAIVNFVLAQGYESPDPHLSWDDVTNLEVDADAMDGKAAAEYINDELGGDWESLIDRTAYNDGFPIDDDFKLEPDDLDPDDIAILQEYIRDHAEPREIYEWWLVDEWLAEQLNGIGESTVTDGQCHWWGRGCTGQTILLDGTLQKIAAKYADYF